MTFSQSKVRIQRPRGAYKVRRFELWPEMVMGMFHILDTRLKVLPVHASRFPSFRLIGAKNAFDLFEKRAKALYNRFLRFDFQWAQFSLGTVSRGIWRDRLSECGILSPKFPFSEEFLQKVMKTVSIASLYKF